MKHNCWEFEKCGKEPDGVNVEEMGVCPAAVEVRADGIHGGKNGGRVCWAIPGTFCHGKVQGAFPQKFDICLECKFYIAVSWEEKEYLTVVEIQKMINRKD